MTKNLPGRMSVIIPLIVNYTQFRVIIRFAPALSCTPI